ncbi:hypothetical protein GIB67_035569 [Kingdonia uniflora]|uniref:non-specific serine/threonine protein kinase n=1 Tax=Kingdonia uniflora TaxID=39325 RepID=A0A7J7LDC1_9MAGN|nr:hypothetical protein GIB67_035569 [Kingdonia uniflora]
MFVNSSNSKWKEEFDLHPQQKALQINDEFLSCWFRQPRSVLHGFLMASEHVETQHGVSDMISDIFTILSSFELHFLFTILVFITSVVALLISYYCDGLSKGFLFLFAFTTAVILLIFLLILYSICFDGDIDSGFFYREYNGALIPCVVTLFLYTFGISGVIFIFNAFLVFHILLLRKNTLFPADHILFIVYDQYKNERKKVLQVLITSITALIYLCGFSKSFAFLYAFSVRGILFTVYAFPVFLFIGYVFLYNEYYNHQVKGIAILVLIVIKFTFFYFGLSKSFLFLMSMTRNHFLFLYEFKSITRILFIFYVSLAFLAIIVVVVLAIIPVFSPNAFGIQKVIIFLYKKYNNQLKVASLVFIAGFFRYAFGVIGILFILYPLFLMFLYKKYTYQMKIASLVIIASMITVIYFFDGLSKSFLFLYTFGITGIIFILYTFPVFLYKKYDKEAKIARLNGEFLQKDLKRATNNFQDEIGSGGWGSVFKGRLDDGTLVAVKRFEGHKFERRVFEAEIFATASVDHAHLVCLRGSCSHMTETGEAFYIVYDLFPNGSLDNWIFPKAGQSGGYLSWKQRYRVAIEVAKALGHLHDRDHKHRILHLDIKPENVLLDDDFRAIVSDFGLSNLMSNDESRIYITERGTYGYKAPEWSLPRGISEKCDIFGYGKLLLDIIFGQQNVCLNQDGNNIYRKYSNGGNTQREQQTFYAFLWKKLTQNKPLDLIDRRLVADGKVDENEVRILVHVALWCLEEDPEKRPGDMRHIVDFLEERKIEGIIRIFPRMFPYKEYENQKNVARFSREFRHKELEIATNDFCYKLGIGGLGSVFKGVLNDGTTVAVKKVLLAINGELKFQEVVSVIASIQHAHVVRIRGYCSQLVKMGTVNVSLFVYDFFSNGSLDYWIFPQRGSHSSDWGWRYKVAEDVARALEYLHDHQILHLNIKPENILLDDNFRAVVSDFGLSKLMREDESIVLTTAIWTAGYRAPECFLGDISEKCDVYSYGVLLLDMFFGERNVCLDDSGNRNDKQEGNSQEERITFHKYMRQEVLSKEKGLELIDKRLKMVNAHEALSLLETALWCLQEDPKERPDMREVITMLLRTDQLAYALPEIIPNQLPTRGEP